MRVVLGVDVQQLDDEAIEADVRRFAGDQTPAVLAAVDPRHGLSFAIHHPGLTFFVMGAVFLAMTGAEALYADMGHFGRRPIQSAWIVLVFPSLALCYLGQGAMLLGHPEKLENPFFFLFPEWALLPMVGLATALATPDEPVNHMKFGIKGLVLAVIVILLMQSKNKESIEKGTFFAIGLLGITNIAIAVLW